MKYVDEYRDRVTAERIARRIAATVTRPWVLMEVCGGQTHSIVRYGLDRMLPPEVELVHGPGCPVCVTSLEMIDRAHAIASRPDVVFTSFGDMLRVPGIERRSARPPQPRRRRARRLFPTRRRRDRPERTAQAGGLLRHRLRDHGPGQRHGLTGRAARRGPQLLDARLARTRPPCDRVDPPGPREPREGIPRPGPCLRHHGLS